jgi:hypothetical protein
MAPSVVSVTLTGPVTDYLFTNPHVQIRFDAKDESGNVTRWAMESYPTGFFHRAGITRDLFKVGDTVTAVLYRPKDGSKNLGYLKQMILPDRRKIEFDNGRPPSR